MDLGIVLWLALTGVSFDDLPSKRDLGDGDAETDTGTGTETGGDGDGDGDGAP